MVDFNLLQWDTWRFLIVWLKKRLVVKERHAYLFVSHKNLIFSPKVHELEEILEGDSPTVKLVKPYMKKEKSIMDNPLSTQVRFQIVSMIMKSIYKKKVTKMRGEDVFMLDKVLDINEMFKTNNLKQSNSFFRIIL